MKSGIRAIDILTKNLINKNLGIYSEKKEEVSSLLLSIALNISQHKEVTIIHNHEYIEDFLISNILQKDISTISKINQKKKDKIIQIIKENLSLNLVEKEYLISLRNFKGTLVILDFDKKVKNLQRNFDKIISAYDEEIFYSFSFPVLGEWFDSTNFLFAIQEIKEKFIKIENLKGVSYKNSVHIPRKNNSFIDKSILNFECTCGAFGAYGEKAKFQSFLHDSFCDYLLTM